ncbi:hypothetical protein GCM10014713_68110 [Streptomyces purpureus]|uniref:Uncharacterized protein n=1 Tax=Streptomyces purpureus TaxID=1951 RepID=A0A918LXW8_9ACTN|nr:hypothetical protein [Streptomyces purpureus]GGT65574.1 hypothetical protein GCM10014713_68110 [Streptomyces purpureus]
MGIPARSNASFPLNGNAQDLLMGAPTELDEARLRELNIQLRKPIEKATEKPSDGRPITESVHPEASR